MEKSCARWIVVTRIQMVKTTRVSLHGSPVMIVSSDLESLGRRVKPKVVFGNGDTMYPRAAKGEGVILADNLANMLRVKLDDIIEIPSPAGMLKLRVLGITIDYSDQKGAIIMDRSVYVKNWKDDTINLVRVYLKKGVPPEEGKRKILDRSDRIRKLFVMTNQQLRDYALKVTDHWFGLTYVQIFVAVLVAILGIVNSLTVSITDRRREFGVLQAVGGLRRQVRQAVWMEAIGIGLVSVVLGLALGAVILFYYLGVIHPTSREFASNTHTPFESHCC